MTQQSSQAQALEPVAVRKDEGGVAGLHHPARLGDVGPTAFRKRRGETPDLLGAAGRVRSLADGEHRALREHP